jgi:hypothetical protein
VGIFHVDILLKNDNTPVRAVDKVCAPFWYGQEMWLLHRNEKSLKQIFNREPLYMEKGVSYL